MDIPGICEKMSSSDEEEIPELVPAGVKVPITIITGFLGKHT